MSQIELVLTVCVVTLASFANSADVPPGGYYQSKYDSLDVEDVLNHKRLVNHYAACLLNRGPCPPQGSDLKRILPEALETYCLRCTEKQKMIAHNTILRLRSEYPHLLKEISDLYDPTGKFMKRFEASLGITAAPPSEDDANLLSNRFGEGDHENDLAGPVNVPASSTSTTTTTTTTTVRSTTKATQPAFLTRWKLTTPITEGGVPYGWRPTLKPFNSLPAINIGNASVQFLGSITDLGSKVLQVGNQVAGMVLSTVQALVGGTPLNVR